MSTLTPAPLEFADEAPIAIEAVASVAGTRAEVWAVLADHETWPRWFSSIKRCEPTSDPASGVGSTRTVTLSGGVAVQERFIAWDEPEVWAFTGVAGLPFAKRLVERVTLRELGPELTEVTYRMAIEPNGVGAVTFRVAAPGIRKALKGALRNLNDEVAARR